MTCDRARRLFGACWDDELTQSERDWLEGHFASCDGCRAEYDRFSRTLELAGSLPRVEPRTGFVDRVLARTRRATTASDRVVQARPGWVPVLAAAAAIVVVAAVLVVVPRLMPRPGGALPAGPMALGAGQPTALTRLEPVEKGVRLPEQRGATSAAAAALVPDSLFDHSEDVEFILDPVSLHRGRPSVRNAGTRLPGAQGQQAIITF